MRRDSWLPFRKRRAAGGENETPSSDGLLLADVRRNSDTPDTEFATEWDDLSGVEVVAGEFVTVTGDGAPASHEPIGKLLQQVRARTGMDVVFVSQFVNGTRLVRYVAADERDPHAVTPGRADPLEATYCQRVLDGRLPAALTDALDHAEAARLPLTSELHVRAHLSVPVVGRQGRVFGTVCAYAHQPRLDVDEARAVATSVAQALARALEQSEQD